MRYGHSAIKNVLLFLSVLVSSQALASVPVTCGGVDDTTALQAAIATASASLTTVELPGGNCVSTATLLLPNETIIHGQGRYRSKITCAPSAAPVCVFAQNAQLGVRLSDFGIDSPGMISLQLGDANNTADHSVIERMAFWGGTYNLAILSCSACRILSDDWLAGFTTAAIFIAALPTNPDGGDSLIDGAWIIGSSNTSGIGIEQVSGGGWKTTNSKIVSVLYGYWANYSLVNHATSALTISHNSIEGCGQDCIAISKQAGSVGNLLHVTIDGNEVGAVNGNGIEIADQGTPWISGLSLTGNTVYNAGGENGIIIGSTTDFTVSGGGVWNGGAPSGYGVAISPSSSNGIVGPVGVSGYGANKILNQGTNIAVGAIGP